MEEREVLYSFMQTYNFATLVTIDQGTPYATHLPVMLDRSQGEHGTLVAHMAKANPQWQHFANGQDVLLIFHGPHSYISPSWYTSEFAVPTWNYTAVHAYGHAQLVEEQALKQQMLTELVTYHEAAMERPWTFQWSDRHINLTKAIVAFTIRITRLEGKAKLSQNRSAEDQAGVIRALEQSPYSMDHQVAALMADNVSTVARQPT
jgi:transcriptional regulator